jgi:hypothetical protein
MPSANLFYTAASVRSVLFRGHLSEDRVSFLNLSWVEDGLRESRAAVAKRVFGGGESNPEKQAANAITAFRRGAFHVGRDQLAARLDNRCPT